MLAQASFQSLTSRRDSGSGNVVYTSSLYEICANLICKNKNRDKIFLTSRWKCITLVSQFHYD
ncbi:hypothetical protein EHR01_06470 [Leptospira mtsangambouensis]|uniref:Uncharacterized protein n=1 Tax=Leptospira mtsangambouensis TaxID=2484912 RepID=A0ABY2P4L9_9LEPT|nr:hypothetical protein EHR01_06470 [Leptospira mtsangambouensis]